MSARPTARPKKPIISIHELTHSWIPANQITKVVVREGCPPPWPLAVEGLGARLRAGPGRRGKCSFVRTAEDWTSLSGPPRSTLRVGPGCVTRCLFTGHLEGHLEVDHPSTFIRTPEAKGASAPTGLTGGKGNNPACLRCGLSAPVLRRHLQVPACGFRRGPSSMWLVVLVTYDFRNVVASGLSTRFRNPTAFSMR
jgi:hypothetical protein